MTHQSECMASGPCDNCQSIINNAIDARHEYNKALEILEELGSMPWVIKDGGTDTADFWRVYENLRDLRNTADRRIPRWDY